LQRFGSFAELFQLLLDTATLRRARRGMQRPGGTGGRGPSPLPKLREM